MIYIKLLSPRYAIFRDFLLALPAKMDTDGEYVYGGKRNLIKRFAAPNGESLIAKRFHSPHFFNKLVYSWEYASPRACERLPMPTCFVSMAWKRLSRSPILKIANGDYLGKVGSLRQRFHTSIFSTRWATLSPRRTNPWRRLSQPSRHTCTGKA